MFSPKKPFLLILVVLSLALQAQTSTTSACESACIANETLSQQGKNVCIMDCEKAIFCQTFPSDKMCTKLLQVSSSGLPSPLYVSYIDSLSSWWPPTATAAAMAVPGYATTTAYNVIILAFWLTTNPTDIASVWADPLRFFSTDNPWGTTKDLIQKNLIKAYHSKGIKVLVSAFGATEFPTTAGADPVKTCTNLATFAKDNNLDGIDLDWEDSAALESGKGEDWLIQCTKAARKVLPVGDYILSHAPQGPYFMGTSKYPNGGYLEVEKEVGNLIDFYNVQFYNQGTTSYDTYDSLFVKSNGWATTTSVKELIAQGIPAQKIVLGKPASSAGAVNSGFVNPTNLKSFIASAKNAGINWNAGVMTWQYSDDITGGFINEVAQAFSSSSK
jgi:chitinase